MTDGWESAGGSNVVSMPSLGRAHFSSETVWKLDAPCADGIRRCVLIASGLDLVITEG